MKTKWVVPIGKRKQSFVFVHWSMNLFCSGFSRFVFLNIISFFETTFFQPLFFFPAQMANSKGLRVGRLVVIVQVVEQL